MGILMFVSMTGQIGKWDIARVRERQRGQGKIGFDFAILMQGRHAVIGVG